MEDKLENYIKPFFIILALTLLILLLNNYIPKQLFLFIGIFFWSLFYIYNKKTNNKEYIILRMLIYSIPLSFTDVFGRFYGESYLSWFNIFLLITIIIYIYHYVLQGVPKFNYLSILSIILILISIVPVVVADNMIEGMKQYINIIVLFILIIIGNSFKENLTNNQINSFKIDYILSSIIASIGLSIQIIFVKLFDTTLGNYQFLGGYREAYGFLFSDYSFLSLYLVSGAMMIYSSKIKGSLKIETFKFKGKWIFTMVFLLVSSVLTSARTGIFAFIVVYGLYSFFYIFKLLENGSKKSFKKSIRIIVSNLTIVIVSYMLVLRTRSSAKFSDSGRSELKRKAIGIFFENPYFGIGFGSSNYIGMLPHNIFFQFLSQGGIFYIVALIIFLEVLIYISYKNDFELLLVLLSVLIGSLFIPNIFNSRFLPILVLLLALKVPNKYNKF